MARLTDKQRSEIRELHATGDWSQTALAKRFGISRGTVQNALAPIQLKGIGLTDEQRSEIRELYTAGDWSHRKLAQRFGTSVSSVQRTLNPIQLKGIKLTDEQQSELRALREQDPKRWTHRALAKHFGISHSAVEYTLDPEKGRARGRTRARTYYQTPKGQANNKKHGRLYRARKLDAPTGFVPRGVDAALLALQGGRCPACDKPLLLRRGHLDHVQPLSKGGAHALTNLLLLHRSCNDSKNDTWPLSDWGDKQRVARLQAIHLAVRVTLRVVFGPYATKVWPSEAEFKRETTKEQRLEVDRLTTKLLLSLGRNPQVKEYPRDGGPLA